MQVLILVMTLVLPATAQLNGTTRTYYIAAVEEDWDYMPRYVATIRTMRS